MTVLLADQGLDRSCRPLSEAGLRELSKSGRKRADTWPDADLCGAHSLQIARDVLARLAVIGLLISCSAPSQSKQPDASGGGDDDDGVQIDAPKQVDIDAAQDGPTERYLCRTSPPPNAPMPAKPPLPTAGCPNLVPGVNSIVSSGFTRQFILVLPATSTPGEKLPVLFMWHWIGGSANGFLTRGDIQTAADAQHFIAVIPEARGANVAFTSFNTKWPFDITQPQTRMDEEFKFFDDMLACVEAQYSVNQSC